jgi:hypothetical protein
MEILAKKVIGHIRRCCVALADGTVKMPRRKSAFWAARVSGSARYWGYPVVTPAVREWCAALNIELDGGIRRWAGVDQFGAFLRAAEGPLMEVLSAAPSERCTVSVTADFDPGAYLAPLARELPAVFAPIQAQSLPGLSLFLHGSMADLQYTPFSDVDDLVVLRREAWQDVSSLMETATLLAQIARCYQDIDPLQHHGHWVVTEFDLLFYDQSYMPLTVLNEAVRVVGQPQVSARLDPDLSGFVRNAANTIKSMQGTLEKAAKCGGLNAFELKGLVGEVAIMPAYLFQAGGEMISKPEAIRRAGEFYSPKALRALEWATMVREEFAPLVHNGRMRFLRAVAKLTWPGGSMLNRFSGNTSRG